MDQFYQTPQSYNPKRRKFIAIAIGAILLAIVGMVAYVYKDAIVSLFSGADDRPILTWGGDNQVNPAYPCLAPVRTTPGQSGGFVFDTGNRLNLFNKGPGKALNVEVPVTLQIQTGPQDQGYQDSLFANNEVTVSTGTYANGVWTIPEIEVGALARITLKRSNMPAVPFNVSLGGGEKSIRTGCDTSSYFSAPSARTQNAPAAQPAASSEPTAVPTPAAEPTKEPAAATDTPTAEVKGINTQGQKLAQSSAIVPIGDVGDGDTNPPTPPPPACLDELWEIENLISSRVLKDEAVVVIEQDVCVRLTFGINGLGPAHELLPYDGTDGQVPVKHQVFELRQGIHYLDLNVMDDPRLACGFQSDLYLPVPPAPAPIRSTHIFSYDWAERTCDTTPPPTSQPLVCAPTTPQTIAPGGTANFTASGGTAPYSWSTTGDNPTKPPTGASASFTYSTAGNYTVTVTDSTAPPLPPKTANCTVIVTSSPPPPPGQTLTCAPKTQNAVIGSPVRFTSTYAGQGLTYRWTATDGDPDEGFSDSFTTTYKASGPGSDPDNVIPVGQTIKKIVTVEIGGEKADCEVILSNAPTNVQTLVCAPNPHPDIFAGGTATFTATGGSGSYVWDTTGDNPTKPPTGASAQFTFGAPGPYTVTVRDSVTTTNRPGTCAITVNAITTQPNANLKIVKTVSNPTPQLDGPHFWYTIDISNLGPNNTTGVSVRDILPAGVTFVSFTVPPETRASPSTTQGTYNVSDGVWTVGALNSGSTASLQIAARANAVGTHRNTATITASSLPDNDPSDNESSVDVTVTTGGTTPSYDIGVTKEVSNSNPSLNQSTQYTITATNHGNSTATSVTLRDVLPSTVTHVSDTASVGSYNESTGIWTIGTMTSGASATLHITFTPNSTGTIVNTVTLNGLDQTDSNSSNNTASATITVSSGGGGGGGTPRADIAVVKTVNNAQPQLNSNVVFTIRAFNNGPRDATDVELRDILPTGLVYVSHSASAGTYNQNTGIWTIGDLDDGDSENLNITATATQLGTIVNTAVVTDSSPNDSNSSNDQDSASVTVGSGGSGPGTDLAVTKTVSNALPAVGSQITYTINLVNVGSTTANNITVIDTLPSGLTFVKALATLGSYNKTNGVWTVGSLPSGGSAVLQITVTVTRVGTIVNTARLNGSDPTDSNPLNNEGQVTITSHAAPGLPAAGLNNAAPIVIGFLFILLSIVVRFLGSVKPQRVYVDDRRKIDSLTRLD